MYAKSSISAGKDTIFPEVEFGENVVIGDRVTIYAGCKIGDDTYIADGASIRENVTIGKNCIIGRYVVIESNISIGDNVKIQALSMIHLNLGNGVFIGPMFNTAADKGFTTGILSFQKIGDDVMIGSGVLLLPGISIGKGAKIGAGAVVTKDVPEGETWVGHPAKKLEEISPTIRLLGMVCSTCKRTLEIKFFNHQEIPPTWTCVSCGMTWTAKDPFFPGEIPMYEIEGGVLKKSNSPPKRKYKQ